MDVSDNIIFKTRFLVNQIERQIGQILAEKFGKDVTGVQFFVLRLLMEGKDDIYQKDIEKKMGIRRSTATEIINNMEKTGLLVRCACPKDKRRKMLIVSEKGKKQAMRFKKLMREITGEIHGEISPEDLSVYLEVLNKICHIIALASGKRGSCSD